MTKKKEEERRAELSISTNLPVYHFSLANYYNRYIPTNSRNVTVLSDCYTLWFTSISDVFRLSTKFESFLSISTVYPPALPWTITISSRIETGILKKIRNVKRGNRPQQMYAWANDESFIESTVFDLTCIFHLHSTRKSNSQKFSKPQLTSIFKQLPRG